MRSSWPISHRIIIEQAAELEIPDEARVTASSRVTGKQHFTMEPAKWQAVADLPQRGFRCSRKPEATAAADGVPARSARRHEGDPRGPLNCLIPPNNGARIIRILRD